MKRGVLVWFGEVKHFDEYKTYGFISTDDGDIFVEKEDVLLPLDEMKPGLNVKFDIGQNRRGNKAINVTRG